MPRHSPLASQASDLLKVLGNPLRLGIVEALVGGEMHVGELAKRLGENHAIISGQLRLLRLSGLVAREHRGGNTFYRLADPRLSKFLACVRKYTEGR